MPRAVGGAMPEVIDAFTHVLPREFFEAFSEAHPSHHVGRMEAQPHLWDVEGRLEDMDDYGIDRQVINLVRPPIWQGLDPAEAAPLVAAANDGVADIAAAHPDRFIPVATFPFPTEAYLDELDRCVQDLDMDGVLVFSNVDGRPLDDDAFYPFYERVAHHDVPIWIHPQLHDWYPWIGDYDVHKILGWPFDTSVALLRLVLGGVLESFPSLRIVAHHVGGMLPFFAGRIETVYEARRQYPEAYPMDFSGIGDRPVSSYFDRIYGDTVIGGWAPAVECGHAFFGDDRLVFGSDYPFGPERGRVFLEQALDVVEALDVTPAARDAVLGGNLADLIGS